MVQLSISRGPCFAAGGEWVLHGQKQKENDPYIQIPSVAYKCSTYILQLKDTVSK